MGKTPSGNTGPETDHTTLRFGKVMLIVFNHSNYQTIVNVSKTPSTPNVKAVKGAQSRLNGLKSLAKLFNFVVCNPCQSSPSLTILVPLWFIIISLIFFYLCKALFSGFPQFNGNLSLLNNSKYRD